MCELAPTPMRYWRNHKNIMWSLVVMSLTHVTVSLVQIIPTVTMNGKSTVALANQVCVIFLLYSVHSNFHKTYSICWRVQRALGQCYKPKYLYTKGYFYFRFYRTELWISLWQMESVREKGPHVYHRRDPPQVTYANVPQAVLVSYWKYFKDSRNKADELF